MNSVDGQADSSRRAIEAADNIVRACELNMQIPDTPVEEGVSPVTFFPSAVISESRQHSMVEGSNVASNPRKRPKSSPTSWGFGTSSKRRHREPSAQQVVSSKGATLDSNVSSLCDVQHSSIEVAHPTVNPQLSRPTSMVHDPSARDSVDTSPLPTLLLRESRIRDLIPLVIYEALRVGGRPDSSVWQPTALGEKIDVRTRSSSGHASRQTFEWSVQADVPKVLPIDDRDLSKLISCVLLNAIKFTENGNISIVVSLSESLRSVRINIIDSGAGIAKDFLPELFQPFSQEDASLTRAREGLGLGLLVAKGLARKLGGDLNLIRTATSGQRKGSQFEIKINLGASKSGSIPGNPFDRTPTPSSSISQQRGSTYSCVAKSNPALASTTPLYPTMPPEDKVKLHVASSESHKPACTLHRIYSCSRSTPVSARSAVDCKLAKKHPLTFLVAEDNHINRKLLVSTLAKLGYEDIHEAFDGHEAVRIMKEIAASESNRRFQEHHLETPRGIKPVDVILMDLWMPRMDGYEATEKILDIFMSGPALWGGSMHMVPPTVIAVSADVTQKAISRAMAVGMKAFMTKPYKLVDLQRLIEEVCDTRQASQ